MSLDRNGRSARALGCLTALVVLGCSSPEPAPSGAATRETSGALLTDPPVWREQDKLLPDVGVAMSYFGTSVAISGNTAVVGRRGATASSGSAYVFTRTGVNWVLGPTLTANDAASTSSFGWSVALDGDTLVVGTTANAAYVFVRTGTAWTQQQKLTSSDGGTFDDVDIDGDSIIGGWASNDGAYVFVRSGATWTQQQKLTAFGPPNVFLGWSVAISGDTALVGDPAFGQFDGGANVYVRSGATWTPQATLLPGAPVNDDTFGKAVALHGETAVVGAFDDNASPDHSGVAYVYERSGTTWGAPTRLTANQAIPGNYFAANLAFDGSTVAVGAASTSGGGAAYVFSRSGGTWTEAVQLTGSDQETGHAFGNALAVDGDSLVAAAYQADPSGQRSGSAYVFKLGLVDASACESDAECQSGYCTSEGVCCNARCGARCMSCLASRNVDEVDGVCGPVKAGTDPRGACKAAECVSETSQQPEESCDGAGACAELAVESCEGYLCANDACRTSCSSDAHCDGAAGFACIDGACLIPAGEACTTDAQCTSEHCVDGVCCDSACDGQCESCAEPGSVGECVGVDGDPRGDREPCPSADEGCEATCHADEPEQCQFASGTTVCDQRCEDGAELVSLCDGQGTCAARPAVDCVGYVCGATRCLSECESQDDCSDGYYCQAGECVGTNRRCEQAGSVSVGEDGEVACGPFLCDEASGACRTSCTITAECAPSAVCNRTTQKCEPVRKSASGSEGGCSVGRSRPAGALEILLFTSLLALTRRGGRRTRPRRRAVCAGARRRHGARPRSRAAGAPCRSRPAYRR